MTLTEFRPDTFDIVDEACIPYDDAEIQVDPKKFTDYLGGAAVGDALALSKECVENNYEFEQRVIFLIVSAAGGLSSAERALIERIVVSLPDARGYDSKYDDNRITFPIGDYVCPIEFTESATNVSFYGRLGPLGAKPIQNETICLY